jgi:hypothetical protein
MPHAGRTLTLGARARIAAGSPRAAPRFPSAIARGLSSVRPVVSMVTYIGLRGAQPEHGHGGPVVVGVMRGDRRSNLVLEDDRHLDADFEWATRAPGLGGLPRRSSTTSRVATSSWSPLTRSFATSSPAFRTSSSSREKTSLRGSLRGVQIRSASRRPRPYTVQGPRTLEYVLQIAHGKRWR